MSPTGFEPVLERSPARPASSAFLKAETNLVDELLAEQQQLTAVERFSRWHDEEAMPDKVSLYSHLIPGSKPAPGEQYGFEVDLDKCTGCKACVAACHSLNGLEPTESWRDVGVLFGGTEVEVVQQTVTTACHHCEDPGCLNGCPVEAYEKDPETGIVRHLDDQCIGCQYCILKCPYDVPKYSKSRGIVRKCDMCIQRLEVGEAPACVQACPTEAIQINVVKLDEVKQRADEGLFLPDTPDPSYTKPTTVYRTNRKLPENLRGGDRRALVPEHAHWPLIFLLVLTQAAVGAFLLESALSLTGLWSETASRMLATTALVVGMLGLNIGILHLGQPWKAWRFFLGLKTSWLSWEVLVFGLFSAAATMAVLAVWVPVLSQISVVAVPEGLLDMARTAVPAGTGVAALLGLGGVWCSIKIYEDTRRPFWRMHLTAGKFMGTTLLAGTALALPVALILGSSMGPVLAACLLVVSMLKLGGEAFYLRHLRAQQWNGDQHSAALMAGPLRRALQIRFALGFLGGVLLPGVLVGGNAEMPLGLGVAIALLCLAGELTERYLYFTAVVALKMPGGVRA